MSRSVSHIHPKALKALNKAFEEANLRLVIVQTLGNAKASAGTHGKDGTYKSGSVQVPYSAAIDLSVIQKATRLTDGKKILLDESRIRWVLYNLAREGIPSWYRRPSQGFDAAHIHGIFSMVPMKPSLENQVIDFLNDRTGLASHGSETFWTANHDLDAHIASLFTIANPEAARRLPAKYRGVAV